MSTPTTKQILTLFRQTHPHHRNPTVKVQRIRNTWMLWIQYGRDCTQILAGGCWTRNAALRQAMEFLEGGDKGYDGGDEMW